MYNRLILFFLLINSFHCYSQKFLKDIASSDANSNINQSILHFSNNLVKGDTLFFLAQDTTYTNYYYKNIWFTDGTAANTKKVTNGAGPIFQMDSYNFLTSYKGKAYYKNVDDSNLYATNGNTVVVVKHFPNSTVRRGGVLNGWLYIFVSNTTSNVLELWKTDGTEANTIKAIDVYNGTHFMYDFVFQDIFLNTGDKIYFVLETSTYGSEPWVTDGTAAGTRMLKDIQVGPGWSIATDFEKVGNTVFFFAYPAGDTRKLYKTDGTEAGTMLVADQIDGNPDYFPIDKISYNNKLYFTANTNKFYKTDGNTVTLIKPDVNYFINGGIVQMNNLMYFIRHNGYDYELWKSDGTNDGTQKIKTIYTSIENRMYVYVRILAGKTKIYFEISKYSDEIFQNPTQHWVSNGTAEGTINISTLNSNFSTGSLNNQLAVVGDTYYFTAYDAVGGFELWKSNGTPMGTMPVKNINTMIASSNPTQFVAFDNEVYFTADDIKHGREIWKTDGTIANTNLVADLNASTNYDVNYSSIISGMIAYNDVMIAQITYQLVKFNKTMPPTGFYAPIVGLANPENPEFIQFNNKIYYKGWDIDTDGGYDLFATDGNTVSKIKDFHGGYDGGKPTNFVVWGGLLYFMTDVASTSPKIWKTDGTEAGTVLVKDLTWGLIESKFYAVNGVLMFVYSSPDYGTELWKTDGTAAGTTLVKDTNPSYQSTISNLTVYNNILYFNGYSGDSYGLYKSDGTYENTQFFSSITSVSIPTVFKNKLFFIGYDAGFWLFSTDGISAPIKIKQLGNVMLNAELTVLTVFNGNLLVFDVLANKARHELWASDGTSGGTKLAKVIREKEARNNDMNIKEYFNYNQKLYFAADDGIHGKELWVWDTDCPEFMAITNAVTQNTDFTADKYIVGSNKVNANIQVSYNANKYIALNPGFETQAGTQFTANMGGCIYISASSNSTTSEPVFKNISTKGDTRPSIMQFLTTPLNTELLVAYETEKNKHKEQNIAWIFDESPDKYILKMHVNKKEYIGYLNK